MNRANVFSGVVCLAFGLIFAWLASQVPNFTMTDQLGGRFFPMLIAIGIIICSIALIITGFMNIEIAGGQVGGKHAKVGKSEENEAKQAPDQMDVDEPPILGISAPRARLFGFIGSMAVYTLILTWVGYVVASLIVFAAMIVIAGERRLIPVAAGAIFITAILYTLFAVVFGMNVPESALF